MPFTQRKLERSDIVLCRTCCSISLVAYNHDPEQPLKMRLLTRDGRFDPEWRPRDRAQRLQVIVFGLTIAKLGLWAYFQVRWLPRLQSQRWYRWLRGGHWEYVAITPQLGDVRRTKREWQRTFLCRKEFNTPGIGIGGVDIGWRVERCEGKKVPPMTMPVDRIDAEFEEGVCTCGRTHDDGFDEEPRVS